MHPAKITRVSRKTGDSGTGSYLPPLTCIHTYDLAVSYRVTLLKETGASRIFGGTDDRPTWRKVMILEVVAFTLNVLASRP